LASYLTAPGPTRRGFSSTCRPCWEQMLAAAHLLIIGRFSSDSAIHFCQLPTRASTGVDANQRSWPLSPSPQCTSASTIPSDAKHCANALWGRRYRPSGKLPSPAVVPSPEPMPRSPLLPPPGRSRTVPSSCAKPAASSSHQWSYRYRRVPRILQLHLMTGHPCFAQADPPHWQPAPPEPRHLGACRSRHPRPGVVPPFLFHSQNRCAKLAAMAFAPYAAVKRRSEASSFLVILVHL
jgi:hypothetical protein